MSPEDAVCEQTPVPLECVLQHPRHKALVADFDDISESMTRLVADYEDLERKLADQEKKRSMRKKPKSRSKRASSMNFSNVFVRQLQPHLRVWTPVRRQM